MIEPIRFYCQKVLPLVYDDSLSYYEALCKFAETLNETIKHVESIVASDHAYTDAQIAIVKADFNKTLNEIVLSINNSLIALQTKVDKQLADNLILINNLKDYVDSSVIEQNNWVSKQISDLSLYIDKQLVLLKSYIDQQDKTVIAYVDTEIQKVIDMIPEITSVMVKNPITGKLETIQQTLDYLTNIFLYFAFTCLEFDLTNLTCSQFDNSEITAFNFDVYGKKYLYKDTQFYMHSPITGSYVFYQDIINWLIAQHQTNVYTCLEFDGLTVTALQFDNSPVTTFEFDFNSKNYFN